MAKKFPDLNKDGKVTQADVLKGRGVFNDGGLSDIEKVMRIVRGMSMSEAKAETPEQAEKAKQQGQRLLDTFDESVLRKAYQRMDAERDNMAMGSLMVSPEREMYGKGGALIKIWKALGKEASPQDKELAQEVLDNSPKSKRHSDREYVTRTAFSFDEDFNTDLLLKKDIPEGSQEFKDKFVNAWRSRAKTFSHDGEKYVVEEGKIEIKDKRTAEDNAARDDMAMGGSLMVAPERKTYGKGKLVLDLYEKLAKPKTVGKKKKMVDEEQALREIQKTVESDPQALEMLSDEDYMEVVSRLPQKQQANFGLNDAPQDDIVEMALQMEPEEVAQNLQLFGSMEDVFEYAGTLDAKDSRKFMNALSPEDKELFAGELPEFDLGPRAVKGHGGSSDVAILMPAEYEEPPKDTYNNISSEEEKEEVENMNSDGDMEEEYLDYVANEVLSQEEQDYLFKTLDEDNKLEEILDKVMLNATEFTGAGEIDGPGTGVSDSIPARLSDGEFVFTKKATDQIGSDKLQKIMDDAERDFDSRDGKANGGEAGTSPFINPEEMSQPLDRFDMDKGDERDIERQMLYSSRMPSLMNR